MNAKLRTEASAVFIARRLLGMGFKADVDKNPSKAYPYLVKTDAPSTTVKALFKEIAPAGSIGKVRSADEATALVGILTTLGFTATIATTARGVITVSTSAPIADLRFAFRKLEAAGASEVEASCPTTQEAEGLVALLTASGFTATTTTAKRSIHVSTNAPRTTLRALMKQNVEAVYSAHFAQAAQEGR